MIWWPLCLKSLPRRTLTFGLFVATFVFIPQVDSVPSAALISLVMLSTIVNVVCFYGAMKFPLRLIVSYFPGKSLPLRSGRWRKLTNVPFSVHFIEPRVVAPDRRFFWPPCVRPQRVFPRREGSAHYKNRPAVCPPAHLGLLLWRSPELVRLQLKRRSRDHNRVRFYLFRVLLTGHGHSSSARPLSRRGKADGSPFLLRLAS
jgi:hypothetical protein